MSDFLRQFRAARRVSTPLVAVRTTDPAQTIAGIVKCLNENGEAETPMLMWDVMQGLIGLNQPGEAASLQLNEEQKPEKMTARPTEMLRAIKDAPADSVIFMSNAHRFFRESAGNAGAADVVIQAIWNLRNLFKSEEKGCMLVLLTTLGTILPSELANDVLVLDEPLPTVQELDPIVRMAFVNESLEKPTDETVNKATDALIGLAAFPAEQATAMCMSKPNGLDLNLLWERKRQTIAQYRGLQVHRELMRFDDLGGLDTLKTYWRQVIRGKNRVRLVVFIDEIEKHFAGSGTDLSGVKTGMTGTFLTWSQDKRARGLLLVGHGGTGKSAIAKAMAAEAGCPCVVLDFDGLQAGIVGSSGENLRAALAIIDAMSQGGVFMVATCNKLNSLPPELRRRFKRGIWFADLPSDKEREAIWTIYRKKHGIAADDPAPDAKEWTGAEIEACCETAEELAIDLRQAAKYVVPISRSAPEAIKELREFANNRFLSVSEPGTYQMTTKTVLSGTGVRKVRGE